MNNIRVALRVLACVYREARELFPLADDDSTSSKCVLVYVDQLLSAGSATEICAGTGKGHLWLLVSESSASARVRRYALFADSQLPRVSKEHRLLHIGDHMLEQPQT